TARPAAAETRPTFTFFHNSRSRRLGTFTRRAQLPIGEGTNAHGVLAYAAPGPAEGGAVSGEHPPPPDGAPGTEVAAASEAPGSTSGTGAPEALVGPGDQPRPGQPWRRPKPFSRPLWYPVAGAAAVLALLAGGGMTLLTVSRGPQARPMAADCGLVTCGASLPPVVTGAAAPSTAAHSITRVHGAITLRGAGCWHRRCTAVSGRRRCRARQHTAGTSGLRARAGPRRAR